MKDISGICEHFDFPEGETCEGRRFFHGDLTEVQIRFAELLPAAALSAWARGDVDYGGPLKEETLAFFIQRFIQIGETEVASELSSILNDRIRVCIANTYRRSLGASAAEDFADELCLEFWAEVLDPNSPQAAWVQICFWRVVIHLAKDYMKKQRRVFRRFTSLDSDRVTVKFVMQLPSNNIGLEDQIYLQEFLEGLNPRERAAFVLRYSRDASIKEIGATVGRSATSVKTVLRRATKHFADAA
jgi:RNA polymerase sigma factor (sigma-70 family)